MHTATAWKWARVKNEWKWPRTRTTSSSNKLYLHGFGPFGGYANPMRPVARAFPSKADITPTGITGPTVSAVGGECDRETVGTDVAAIRKHALSIRVSRPPAECRQSEDSAPTTLHYCGLWSKYTSTLCAFHFCDTKLWLIVLSKTREYVFTGVGLSVCLSVCLCVCVCLWPR